MMLLCVPAVERALLVGFVTACYMAINHRGGSACIQWGGQRWVWAQLVRHERSWRVAGSGVQD